MRYCPKCRAKVSEDAQFCTECGTKISESNMQISNSNNKLKKFNLLNEWEYLLSLLFCILLFCWSFIASRPMLPSMQFLFYFGIIISFIFNIFCLDPDKNIQYYKYKFFSPRYMVGYGMLLGIILCNTMLLAFIFMTISTILILLISILFINLLFNNRISNVIITSEMITTLMLIGTFCLGFNSIIGMMLIF